MISAAFRRSEWGGLSLRLMGFSEFARLGIVEPLYAGARDDM